MRGDRAHTRLEAVAKVTGRATYTSDVRAAGLLEAAILRSAVPHARVRPIDVDAARALPGVVAVLTHADLADLTWYEEQSPILTDVARFVGDELAVVAADSTAALERAVAALRVDGEPREHVTYHVAAAEPGAPIVHDGFETNVVGETERYERGDVDVALADAAHVVVGTFTTPAQVHHPLEPHGAVVSWDGRTLTAYVSTQSVHDVRDGLAETLGLPTNRVRVITEHMGGGFGAKQIVWKPTALAAVLAVRTGRPVRLMVDRHGQALASGYRNATRQTVRLGADDDGRLVAIDAEILVGTGAYTLGGESSSVDGPYQYLYRCEHVRTVQTTVRTHHGPSVAFRAPGYVEGAFALESAVDELARVVGIDPVELRRRNLPRTDQVDDRPLSAPDALATCIDRATDEFGWDGAPAGDGRGRVRRGRGFAAHDWMGGKPRPPAFATVALHTDGSILVTTGTQDIGTGTRTVLAQTVADVFGVGVDRVAVALGDTGHGLFAPVSSGSATVPTMAPAVHAAACDARDRLLAAAAEHLDVPVGQVEWAGDGIRHPNGALGLAELLDELAPQQIVGHGTCDEPVDDVTIRTFGAVCCDVEVDVATGAVRVLRVVCAPDSGRLVNPLLARSQVIGGVTQGIGFALTEHEVVDHRLGVVLNANLEDYLVPTIADSCEIVHAEVDLPDDAANSLGAKGLGELPMIAVAPAIANAVADAVGVRIHDLPITRRRLLDALADRSQS